MRAAHSRRPVRSRRHAVRPAADAGADGDGVGGDAAAASVPGAARHAHALGVSKGAGVAASRSIAVRTHGAAGSRRRRSCECRSPKSKSVTTEWMIERPLKHLARCRAAAPIELLASLQARGIELGVLSDYPAAAKLERSASAGRSRSCCAPTDPEIGAFKPHPRGFLRGGRALAARSRRGADGRRSRRCRRGRRGRGRDAVRHHRTSAASSSTDSTRFRFFPLLKGFDVSSTTTSVAERPAATGSLGLRADCAHRSLVQERLHAARRHPGGVLRARAWSRGRAWCRSSSAVFATCLVASSNYVLNELLDGPNDLLHPEKRFRPVPSGRVRPALAYAEWLLLAAVGFALSRVAQLLLLRVGGLALGDGHPLQRAADPHQGVAVPGRAQRIDQQPDSPAARLVRAGDRPLPAAVAGHLLLDGRRVLHGDEALRGVPPHRRPRGRGRVPHSRSRTTPKIGC